jgi:hypothetical protein
MTRLSHFIVSKNTREPYVEIVEATHAISGMFENKKNFFQLKKQYGTAYVDGTPS